MKTRKAKNTKDWIACIDFGTTLSKVAVVRAIPREKLKSSDVVILGIAERPGVPVDDGKLLPSSVFIHSDRIVFGSEAELNGITNSNYLTFTSIKQYLSLHHLSELDELLPDEFDQTKRYTPRMAITLFLAHLLHQAGVVAAAAGVPWPVPIRIARPAWDRDRAKECESILTASQHAECNSWFPA